MDPNQPNVRLNLEIPKQKLIALMSTHIKDIEAMSEDALDEAIKSFDFKGEIRKQFHESIRQVLQNYFRHGVGYKAVEETVREHFLAAWDEWSKRKREEMEKGDQS